MRNETRARFNTYVGGLATTNGIADPEKTFAVLPSVQQRNRQCSVSPLLPALHAASGLGRG